MLDPAHLHDADVPSDGRAHPHIDLAHAQVDDSVREELFHAEVRERRRVPRHLRDAETRRVQVPRFLEGLDALVPRALQLSDRIEGIEARERARVPTHLLLAPRELSTE